MRFLTLLPGALFVAMALVASACGDLKSADGAASGDGGGGNDGAGGNSSDGASGGHPDAGGDAGGGTDSGVHVSGDPRFPLWPTPADAPPDSAYVITNGADGATVKDTITGLEWQDAADSSKTFDFAGAGSYCVALFYNGAHDWRMPTRIEAVSIMSIKPDLGASAPTGPAFTATTASCTWTASPAPKSTDTAFSIDGANVSAYRQMTDKCAARCVRGGAPLGAPVPRQYVLDATTVTDPVTGLVWERNPPLTDGPLDAADARCKALSLGTPPHAMRLPTFKELAGMVDETRSGPASSAVFGALNDRVFSSDPRWTVNFDLGAGVNGPPGFDYASRCVSGP